jgi:hypothetical protein
MAYRLWSNACKPRRCSNVIIYLFLFYTRYMNLILCVHGVPVCVLAWQHLRRKENASSIIQTCTVCTLRRESRNDCAFVQPCAENGRTGNFLRKVRKWSPGTAVYGLRNAINRAPIVEASVIWWRWGTGVRVCGSSCSRESSVLRILFVNQHFNCCTKRKHRYLRRSQLNY